MQKYHTQTKNILKLIILLFNTSTKAIHYAPTIPLFDTTNPAHNDLIQKINTNIIKKDMPKHRKCNISHSMSTTCDTKKKNGQQSNIITETSHPITHNPLTKSDDITIKSFFFKIHLYTKKQYQQYHQWRVHIQKINMPSIFSPDIKQNSIFIQSRSLNTIHSIMQFFLQKIISCFFCIKKNIIEQTNQKKDLPNAILLEPHYSITYLPNSFIKILTPDCEKIEIQNNSASSRSSSSNEEDFQSFSAEKFYSQKEKTDINLAITPYVPDHKNHQIFLSTLCNNAIKKMPWFIINEAESLNHPIITKMIYPKFNPVKIAFIPKDHERNYQDNDIFDSFSDSDSYQSFSDSDCQDEFFSEEESDSSDELHNKVENTKKTNRTIQDVFWDTVAYFTIKKIDAMIQ